MPQQYPFTAVVGSDSMTLALLLATLDPGIGGVLVRGEKGTAKTTAVRGLAQVLPPIDVLAGDRFSVDPSEAGTSPDAPFANPVVQERCVRLVELPVGATEDRLLGSIHLEKALTHGQAEYDPGLLARAHRGLLYVDEVNLLHDHLVDVLLDAAATGRANVERDGVSVTYPSRFVLVGTMNPEEGELRPQLLDRFGLTVEVRAPRDPGLRASVVRRRMAFDLDPIGFGKEYDDPQAALTQRIADARALLPHVPLTDAVLQRIARVCAGFEVDGMRADLVVARAASAHAAWQGRATVLREDIRTAALLALPHRRRRNPFDAPGLDEDLLDRLLDQPDPEPDPEPDQEPDPEADQEPESGAHSAAQPDTSSGDPAPVAGDPAPVDRAGETHADSGGTDADSGETHADSEGTGDGSAEGPGTTTAPGSTYLPRLFTVNGTGDGAQGRRSRARTSTGRRVGARPLSDGGAVGGGLHLIETLRAAIPHQAARGRTTGRLQLAPEDLRAATREGRESNLVLLCVDASGSMAARKRMEQVKGAVLSLLLDAYRRRDRVGLITFRGDGAELALPPTGSVDVAARALADLPAGGRTPLAEGLLEAADVLRRERLRDPARRPLLVIVTDGRATQGKHALNRAHLAAAHLAGQGVAAVVLDCETGRFRMGLARDLAGYLHARHVPVGEVSAGALAHAVRASTPGEGAA